MRGVEVPPATDDFTADPVELFFDLAFVLAFSQLVGRLVHDHDWNGVGKVALLFGLLWLPWSQFTWAANAISGNGRTVRVLFLVATAASVPMAAATSTALESGGPVFAGSIGVIYLIGAATQLLGVTPGTKEVNGVLRWIVPNIVAMVVLVGGSFVDGSGRIAVWLVTLAIVLGAMIAAGRYEWLVRPGHMAERHALIIIIALGEVIVAIGLPVIAGLEAGKGVPGDTVAALAAAGAFAGLVWWSYFDRPGPALEHRGASLAPEELGRYVRDVYTWAHAPIVAGVILSAAALEEIALHPGDAVPLSFRAMFFGGLTLTTIGVSAAVARAFGAVARERLIACVALGVVLLTASSLSGIALVLFVDAVVLVTLLIEHVRIER